MKDDSSIDNNIEALIDSIKTQLPSAAEITSAGDRAKAAIASHRLQQGLKQEPQHEMQQGLASQDLAAPRANDSWNSIDDYIAAIPEYLAKQLTPQQTLLFEEESRQSIPLRRALNEARAQASDKPDTQVSSSSIGSSRYRSWAVAAMVAAVAVAIFLALPNLPSFDQSRLAQVDEIDGELYQIVDGGLQILSPGTWIDGRQRIRSANGSSALITLDDGSQIEVDERSELSMTRRGSGNRIDVSRGRILVAASPQGSGTLDVFTDEFMVSVTGTIFEVAHGAKGSRVAVIEGSVNVFSQGNTSSLKPGDMMDSRVEFLARNIADEIAWSRDADEYIAMVQEIAGLQQDLQAVLATAPRYSTRLLDIAPQDTAMYIAVPNAPEKVADVYEVIRARMQGSEFLSEAWATFEAESEAQYLDEIMAWLREIGYALGEETVFAMAPRADGEMVPLVLSEVDAEAFRASFDDQIQRLRDALAAEGVDTDFEIAVIDDPADAIDAQLSILLVGDLLVASVDAEMLYEMQAILENGSSAFVDTELHSLLRYSYDQGTEILGAVNIQQMFVPFELEAQAEGELDKAGLSNAEYLVAQHKQEDGDTSITADIYFDGNRQGAMAWLASPAPMGSLEFFSTDTTVAAAMLIKEPISILEEFGPIDLPEEVGAQAELELFYNLLGVLGGEMAFGLDGPALPTPAWKVVIEAYDASTLQASIDSAVERFNQYAVDNDVDAVIEVSAADVAGYSGFEVSLDIELPADSVIDSEIASEIDFDLGSATFNYAFVDGYLVAAPNAALIGRAIGFYESGSGLQTDSEFQELLARDGYLDFSAVYFSRLGELIGSVLQNLPSDLSEEQRAAVSSLDPDIGATVSSVLALPDRIHFAHSGSTQLPAQLLGQLVALQPFMESMVEDSAAAQ